LPIDRNLTDRVLAGDRRAVARAISVVEEAGAEGRALIREIFAKTGRAYVIGVTGAPGTGKSTLVDRFVVEARRAQLTAGVLAIDPSSPFTGGAILADRVRMTSHDADPGVFIRSMATRGHLGGLALATGDAALVLDAAGFDIVVIETVGVGQDEVDIVSASDIALVVLVPGAGDDLQAIKAGVMEIADIFVVNKADRDNADDVVHAVSASLALQTFGPGAWAPPIVKTNALSGDGADRLWAEVERFRHRMGPAAGDRRVAWQARHLRNLLAAAFVRRAEAALPPGEFDRLVADVVARTLDPYSAVASIVERV
jgi:LAO/AO transport system kinase